ncbi:hypothetical protein Pyn_30335 [Prunus yedoensis var. nudiflora]|uniref:Uncharacterized protein n=1 Tax=Prunus yedoensis var. nudiflora TaxID=2094558 RepID=A0A314XJ40_PRUYE|nr:hypothetical protein Pyn_30335 [Prunus yedoensis var. nudiflora]
MDVLLLEEVYFSRGVQAQVGPDIVDDRSDLKEFVTLESLCNPTRHDELIDRLDTTPETTQDSLDARSCLVSTPAT